MAYEDEYLGDGTAPNEHASPDNASESPGPQDESPEEMNETTEEGSSPSLFVSPDDLGGKDYKAGDEIVFKVLGKNADGELEICVCKPEDGNEFDMMERQRNTSAPMPG